MKINLIVRKYLLLLFVPLFALSCNSDDDKTDVEIRNDRINNVISTSIKELGSDTYDFREHKETSIALENIEEYKNTTIFIARLEKFLEDNPNLEDKEKLEQVKADIVLYKARVAEMEKAYTNPLYTVIFGYGDKKENQTAIGYVSTKFEFIGWDPI